MALIFLTTFMIFSAMTNGAVSLKCFKYYPEEYHNVPVETLETFKTSIESAVKIQQFSSIPLLNSSLLYRKQYLNYLDLSSNYISELENNVFQYIGICLESLYLQDNLLTKINKHTFSELSFLKILNLNKNQITDIDGFAFYNLTLLDKLILSRNFLSYLQQYTFTGLNNLTEIDLSHNLIHLRYYQMFEFMQNIKTLLLDYNEISYIGFGIFQNLPHLKNVSLSNNKLTIFNVDLFSDLSALLHLNLSNNFITNITEKLDFKLTTLNTLILDNNLISHLDVHQIMSCFPQLKFIGLRNTLITCQEMKYITFNFLKISVKVSGDCSIVTTTIPSITSTTKPSEHTNSKLFNIFMIVLTVSFMIFIFIFIKYNLYTKCINYINSRNSTGPVRIRIFGDYELL